jgi:hypothetical protein
MDKKLSCDRGHGGPTSSFIAHLQNSHLGDAMVRQVTQEDMLTLYISSQYSGFLELGHGHMQIGKY